MKILGIIPARGGSKGIPGKNIKVLGGKPLIAWTIDQARKALLLNYFMVNTDDEQIAETARQYGAQVPFLRPTELAADETPTLDVVEHTLRFFGSKGQNFDAVCLLQPTSPFRPDGLIDQAIKTFIESDADALVTVRPVPDEFNPHWVFEPDEQGFLKIATGDTEIIPRRQELPPAYFRDGSIYLTKSEVILERHSLYGEKLAYLVMPDNVPYINLDTPSDWEQAERIIAQQFF